jgi:hypothetical protein
MRSTPVRPVVREPNADDEQPPSPLVVHAVELEEFVHRHEGQQQPAVPRSAPRPQSGREPYAYD